MTSTTHYGLVSSLSMAARFATSHDRITAISTAGATIPHTPLRHAQFLCRLSQPRRFVNHLCLLLPVRDLGKPSEGSK